MVPLPPLRDGGRALPIPSFRQTCLPLILDAPDCICSPGRLLLGGGRTYASYTMRKPSGRFPSGGRLVICFMDGRSGTLGLGGIRAAAVALAEHVAQAGVAHFGDHVRDEVRGHRHVRQDSPDRHGHGRTRVVLRGQTQVFRHRRVPIAALVPCFIKFNGHHELHHLRPVQEV